MEQLHNKNHYTFRNANLHKKFGFQHLRIKNDTQEVSRFCMFTIIYQILTAMKNCSLDAHKTMVFCAIFDVKDAVVKKFFLVSRIYYLMHRFPSHRRFQATH